MALVYTVLMALRKILCRIYLMISIGSPFRIRPLQKLLSTKIGGYRPLLKDNSAPTRPSTSQLHPPGGQPVCTTSQPTRAETSRPSKLPKSRSASPAAILGSAVVARSEIAFFIRSVAESKGIFRIKSENGSYELYSSSSPGIFFSARFWDQ